MLFSTVDSQGVHPGSIICQTNNALNSKCTGYVMHEYGATYPVSGILNSPPYSISSVNCMTV